MEALLTAAIIIIINLQFPALRSLGAAGIIQNLKSSIENKNTLLLAATSSQQLGSSSDGGVDAAVTQSSIQNPKSKIQNRMTVTAYCGCKRCCGKNAAGITASGHKIKRGNRFVAADSAIPFGTRISIPGYNDGQPVEVKDRGKAITADRLDVYFESHAQARAWGVKNLDCKFPIE